MPLSYFNKIALKEKLADLQNDGHCPDWLIQACRDLAENAEDMPVEADARRFVVEYIYPH